MGTPRWNQNPPKTGAVDNGRPGLRYTANGYPSGCRYKRIKRCAICQHIDHSRDIPDDDYQSASH
jgi:hypothetical protein